jgi:SAM-dependent methyltransferase
MSAPVPGETDDELAGFEPQPDDVDAGSREHYLDAELYDYEYRRRRRDVRFYRDLARELTDGPSRVLDLACGSGRLMTGLLRDGHGVLGADISLPMLRRARARIGKLGRAARDRGQLVCADARQLWVADRFPLIAMAFNSLEHLYTRVEVEACLANVRDMLAPGGHFVFDVQNPNLRWLTRDPRKRWARTRFRHPSTGEQLEYSTNHVYDPVSQIVVIRIYYRSMDADPPREQVVRLSQRKFFPAELEALVHSCGFAVEARFGDFEGAPLDGDAESQLLVCRAR